jgi:hypothetical protein
MCMTRSLSASRASKQVKQERQDTEEENYTNSSWLSGSRIGGRLSGGDCRMYKEASCAAVAAVRKSTG